MRRNSVPAAAISIFLFSFALAAPAQNTITTIAGGGPPNGVKATTVPVGLPWGVVQDSAGNSYISDTQSNRIFKVDTSGNFSVIAGTGASTESGDGGPAIAAALSRPEGIALDTTVNAGALYIADTANNVIRVVNTNSSGNITLFNGTGAVLAVAAGQIAVVAGTGAPCSTAPSCGDTGFANAAQLTTPGGVAVDSVGNIYIADTGDSVVREVSVTGVNTGKIQLVAGNYTACSTSPCGDLGPPANAYLNLPGGVFVDANSDILIADTGDAAIRVVNISGTSPFLGVSIPKGDIGTVAGTLLKPCTTAPSCGDKGSAAAAMLNAPTGLFYDSSNLWIADSGNAAVREVSLVSSVGTIVLAAGDYKPCTTAPCGDGSLPTLAKLTSPTTVFEDSAGDIFIADQQGNAIRQVSKASGDISTFAGIDLNAGYYGDGGPATPDAEFLNMDGVATDAAGNVYIADTGNNVVRKVGTNGNISTVAGNGSACVPAGFPCGDGAAATSAQLNAPQGVFVDGAGNIFVADTGDNVIREVVAATGKIQTVAGTDAKFPCKPSVTAPECGDLGPATGTGSTAQLGLPADVFLDNSGNIYIADTNDNVVRVVNTQTTTITVAGVQIKAGDIDTVAGDAASFLACSQPPSPTACGDNSQAIAAHLNSPEAVFVDGSGNIFIADNGDLVIRKVDANGTITTVAGSYAACSTSGCGDGGSATLSATFRSPWGLWLDYAGNIFIADAGLNSIRAVNTQATAIEISGITIQPGDITTVVGSGVPGFAGDGGPATSAELDRPHGIAGDAAGDLFITDFASGRVRKVAKLLGTAPTASLSASTLTFSSQQVGTSSGSQSITITNNGNVTSLTVSGVAISGTNAADFTPQINACTSVAAGSTCTIKVIFKPSASGTRTATLKVTDDAANSPQTVTLTGTAVTPAASLSPSKLTFSSEAVGAISGPQAVTVTNNQDFTTLAVTGVAISGTNAADFKENSNCTLVAAGATCTVSVVFEPSASGTRTATLTVTDDAANSPQTVTLTGTAASPFTLPTSGTLSPSSVTAGGSATATITVTAANGFSGAVALTCSVSPTQSPAPTCSFSKNSVTPTSSTPGTSTLTVATTAATTASTTPAILHGLRMFYATWLLLPAMLLSTVGMRASRSRKAISCLLLVLAVGGCLFLAACGGGSSSNSGTGGSPSGGTPSGQYTITVKATSGSTTQTEALTLTVQ